MHAAVNAVGSAQRHSARSRTVDIAAGALHVQLQLLNDAVDVLDALLMCCLGVAVHCLCLQARGALRQLCSDAITQTRRQFKAWLQQR